MTRQLLANGIILGVWIIVLGFTLGSGVTIKIGWMFGVTCFAGLVAHVVTYGHRNPDR